MIELKTGDVYTASRANSGQSSRGPWQLLVVKDSGKSRKEVTVWVTNLPQNISAGQKFRLSLIRSAKYAARKDNNGNWVDEVSVQADIEPLVSNPFAGGVDVDASGFDDNPFTSGDDELPY